MVQEVSRHRLPWMPESDFTCRLNRVLSNELLTPIADYMAQGASGHGVPRKPGKGVKEEPGGTLAGED